MNTQTPRQKLISQIHTALGGNMLEIDLEPSDYDYAVDVTLDRYRQRSGNSIEESFIFLDVQPEVFVYTLPQCVQEVKSVYRNVIGNSGGTAIDPFSLGFTNNLYLLQNPGGMGGSGAGQLATYDYAMQFQNLAAKMFGRDVTFTWDTFSKRLTFHRKFVAVEQIALHVYNERPEEILIQDVYSRPWIRSMAIAQAKMLLGQARSTYGSIAGPQGGITLNGDSLKTEAQADMDKLEEELKNLIDQREGYGFVVG
jgi:hypothetical protein